MYCTLLGTTAVAAVAAVTDHPNEWILKEVFLNDENDLCHFSASP